MKIKSCFFIILAVFLLNGCATQAKSKNEFSINKSPKIYKLDLDCDGKKEIIDIQDNSDKNGESILTIAKPDRSKIDSISFAGRFIRLEFIDLNADDNKQIAVYSQRENNCTNLIIYRLNNSKLLTIFNTGSSYGIDTSFGSVLARISVAKLKYSEKNPSLSDTVEWERWVWVGERFIKE
ncbi:MAG: hypothetical protein V2A64_05235 [Candidatus Omnitrophota bacterium]